ncbi:MAG: hypothetical protein ABII82_17660, partial [Verrucomicrobiota bacterium]
VLIAAGVITVYISAVTQLARNETERSRAKLIGILVRALIVIQAGFVLSGNIFAGAAILAMWFISTLMAKRFYSS